MTSFNKVAVLAFYDAGYITLEEAEQLSQHDWAKRNECTNILLTEFDDKIDICCLERIDSYRNEIIFDIEYDRFTGGIKTLS